MSPEPDGTAPSQNGRALVARPPGGARKVCGARKKNGLGLCPRPAMANGRCYMHGGATPSGFENPKTQSGKYSRVLPERMLARYEESLADPDLLSTRDDIALVTGAISDRLAQLREQQSAPNWEAIVDMVEDFADNAYRWDFTMMQAKTRQLSEVVRGRQAEAAVFEDIRSLVDQRARLVAQENKRLIDLQQMITVEQALTLARRLAAIVTKHVDDEETRRAILVEIRDVMTYGAAPR